MWAEILNNVIDYIEDHLSDKIDNDVIEKMTGFSFYNFDRAFTFIFNMTVFEYIRCRRLSVAASELLESSFRIVDIALKYGYGSHESFSRAFLQFHNIMPSDAKEKDYMLKYCFKAEVESNIKANIKIGRLKDLSTRNILNAIQIKETHEINLANLVQSDDTGTVNVKCGELTAACAEDKFVLFTADEYRLPVKIDITAKTDSSNLKILYGKGDITLNWQYSDWNYKNNELALHDIITGDYFGYPGKGNIERGVFNDISWIIDRGHMALVISGGLRYYNEYLPYITRPAENKDRKLSSKIGVAPAWGSVITVKRLIVHELH